MTAGPLTAESLIELCKSLPKVPLFFVSHWLTGSIYFSLTRNGHEELRMSPQAFDTLVRLTPKEPPTAYHEPFGTDFRHEEQPPDDVLDLLLRSPSMHKHLRMPSGFQWGRDLPEERG